MKIELMEKNLVTSDTLVGMHVYNLYDWLMLAYKRQQSVFPLREWKEKKKERARMLSVKSDDDDDSGEGAVNDGDDDSDDDDDDDDEGGDSDDESDDSSDAQPLLKSKQSSTTYGMYGSSDSGSSKGKSGKSGKSIELTAQDKATFKDKAIASEAEEESNMNQIFNQVNVYLGVGEAVADDADWFNMTAKDRDTGEMSDRGRVAISISIVPEAEYVNT